MGKPDGGTHFEDLSIDVTIILKWISKIRLGRRGLDRSGSGQEEVAGCCECCDEPSGFQEWKEFLD